MYTYRFRGYLIFTSRFYSYLRNTPVHNAFSTFRMCYSSNTHRLSLIEATKRHYSDNKYEVDVDQMWPGELLPVDQEFKEKLRTLFEDINTRKLFKVIELEIDVLRHSNGRVPEIIRPRDWADLLQLTAKSRRIKYLLHLFLIEKKKQNVKIKKEKNKLKRAANPEPVDEVYGLGKNSMFFRIYDKKIMQHHNAKLEQAMRLQEPKVVFDCSYTTEMNKQEISNCAKQLAFAFGQNRIHPQPFDIHFCNAHPENALIKFLHRAIPTLYEPAFPINLHSCSYLDIFHKSQLVYLTPDSRQQMDVYDPDLIYIIGAIVDKSIRQPLSFTTAKKEGIRTLSLPLNQYMDWGAGSSKSLTLNQLINILLDIRYTKDWNKAFKHVPTRKLRITREYNEQMKLKKLLQNNPISNNSKNQYDYSFERRKKQIP